MSGTLPSLDPITGQWTGLAARPDRSGVDPSFLLPTLAPAQQPGALGAGLNVGWQNFVGSGGSFLEATGRAAGIDAVERYGRSVADARAQRAQEVGRADLATPPWREGGASVLPWLGYNLAQQVPNLATTVAAFAAGGPAGGAAAASGWRAGLGAVASALRTTPGGLLAGASMVPQAGGSMYREAVESAQARTGDPAARPSVEAALGALALSPVYAAAEAIPTGRYLAIARGAGRGAPAAGRAMRAAAGAAEGAATEFVTEGVQSVMEQMFRPDLTLGQRASNVLDGALTGMAVGGVLGGGAGALSRNATRAVRDQSPSDTSNDALTGAIDQVLQPTPMSAPAAATAAQPDLFGAPTQMRPAEGDVRIQPEEAPIPTSAQPTEAMREFPLPEPPAGASLLRPSDERVPAAIRQALQDAGDTAKDNQDLRQFMRRFSATDDITLAREVRDQLDNPRAPKRLLKLAEGLGFFDAEGSPRDFDAELQTARAQAQDALAKKDAEAADTAARRIEAIRRAQRIQAELAQADARQPMTEAEARATQPRLQNGLRTLPIPGSLAAPPETARESAGAPLEGSPLPLPPREATPVLPGLEAPAQPSLPLAMPQQRDRAQALAEIAADPTVKAQERKAAQRELARLEAARANAEVARLPLTATADPRDIAVLPPQSEQPNLFAPPPVQPPLGRELDPRMGMQFGPNDPRVIEAARQRDAVAAPARSDALPLPPSEGPQLDLQPPQAPQRDVSAAGPALPFADTLPWRQRVASLLTTEGLLKQTTDKARRWLIQYDVTGMAPDMQRRAERIIAEAAQRVGEAPTPGGVDAVQVAGPAGVDVRAPAPARGQVAEGNTQGQGAPAPRAEKAAPQARAAAQVAAPKSQAAAAGRAPSQPRSPASGQAMVPAPQPAAPVTAQPKAQPRQETAQEIKRRQIAERNATAKAEPAPADEGARVRLNKEQKDALLKIARSPIASPNMQREALTLANDPVVSRAAVMSLVQAHNAAVAQRQAALERTKVAPQAKEVLQKAAKDQNMNPVFRGRVQSALDDLRRGLTSAERTAREVANDYLRRIGETPVFLRANRTETLLGPLSSATKPMPPQAATAALQRAVRKLPEALRDTVQMVATGDALPQVIKDQAASDGVPLSGPGGISAVYYQGTTYIVQDQMRSAAEVQEAVLHEVLGHRGVRAQYTIAALNDIFERAGGRDGVMALAEKYGVRSALAKYLTADTSATANARLVDELLAQVAGTRTGSLGLMLREWAGRVKQALMRYLTENGMGALAQALSRYTALDVATSLRDMRQGLERAELGESVNTPAFQVQGPIRAAADRATGLVGAAHDMLMKSLNTAATGTNVSHGARAQVLYVTTLNHIARVFGRLFPVTKEFRSAIDGAQNLLENVSNINRRRAAIAAKFGELFTPTWTAYERMDAADPKMAERLRWLMEVTAYEVDPRKDWASHTWLHDHPRSQKMEALVREANKKYNELRKPGYGKVFDDMALYNQMQRYASMTTLMHNVVTTDPQRRVALPEAFRVDPMTAFLNASALAQNSVESARDYWKAQFERRLGEADSLWRREWEQERNQGNKNEATWTRMPATRKPFDDSKSTPRVNQLAKTLRELRTGADGLQKHPYFHLGRVGDYFASFTMRLSETEKGSRGQPMPDDAAAEKVSQALLAAGFDDFSIPTDGDRANVFLRVETPQQLKNLDAVLSKLQSDGVIDGLKSGHRDEESMAAAVDAKFLHDAMSRFSASHVFDPPDGATDEEKRKAAENRDKAISQLKEVWMNMLPATSEARIMTRRKVVPGWSKNMMTSYAFRANVGNLSLANLSTSAQMHETMSEMRGTIRGAELADSKVSVDDKLRMHQVLMEVMTREADRPVRSGRDFVDAFRAVNYAYFLGMSPSYALNNLTQVYVTLWPELAKQHGFVKSARAIASSMGQSLKIMYHVFKSGMESSARQAAEPDITEKALTAAGVPKDTQEYILRLINTGVVDIGGAARELGRLAERNTMGGLDSVLRYAGAFGLYSEAAVRLASGLALRDLTAGKKADQDLVPDAVRLIDDTMFNYTEANVGRALGRQGVAGRYTPVAAAFQQFNAQMLEKLYREFADAIATARPGETKEQVTQRRREARKFLATHAAAMTVLAGSLGLPFVTAVAAAVNRLADLFGDDDDEPFDMVASWRNFLSTVLGQDLGEVAARGVPRALGFDMSTRVGEQNIIPLSRFLADRRRWEDAFPDQVANMVGAPWSMVGNLFIGMREMADGNIGAAMQKALPAAIRGPAQAFRMTQQGFVDNNGVRLPIEPTVAGTIAQALGYTPANRAEYSEARQAQASRRGVISREATNIRNNLARALETGDTEAAREWLREARQFDRNQPAYAILPRLGSVLQQRALARTRADALDVPLGVSLRDNTARERTAYANF